LVAFSAGFAAGFATRLRPDVLTAGLRATVRTGLRLAREGRAGLAGRGRLALAARLLRPLGDVDFFTGLLRI
jgi:hypothetical protein